MEITLNDVLVLIKERPYTDNNTIALDIGKVQINAEQFDEYDKLIGKHDVSMKMTSFIIDSQEILMTFDN